MGSLEQLVIDMKESLGREILAFRQHVDQRFDAAERRLDRLEASVAALQIQVAGISRSMGEAERIDSRLTATQMAQQQAIDDLVRRVTRLEQRLEGR